ncbi:NAD(P) transhydrogenase subunit alpha, partial [bacterium]|nr:NAD(P) transhydrogenase subunit alpha [bacterium]
AAVLAFLDPLGNPAEMARFASASTSTVAMEMVPRTTLAQMMDALSSQATVAGYEAVLLAASEVPRFMPMLTTAAGTVAPCKVLVLGAGVAGLQAIATSRRLGAVTAGYDIRPAAREQVESLGATFVGGPVEEDSEDSGGYAGEVTEDTRKRQMEALGQHVMAADIVITTAQVPGRAAPRLITRDMVEGMRRGSVVIDLAASTGGNCEVTVAGETVDLDGVRVMGPLDLASRGAAHASEMYSRNVTALIKHLTDEEGAFGAKTEDEITAGVFVTRGGEIVNERVAAALEGGS